MNLDEQIALIEKLTRRAAPSHFDQRYFEPGDDGILRAVLQTLLAVKVSNEQTGASGPADTGKSQ